MQETVRQYRKKPVLVYAVKWDGRNTHKVEAFCGGKAIHRPDTEQIAIQTLEGTMTASIGDYIIQGTQGEFYPCKPQPFKDTFEETR